MKEENGVCSQRGSILIYLVAVILIAGVLGLGIVSLTTTSAFTGLRYNPSDQARFLAASGVDYAIKALLSEPAYPVAKTLVVEDGEIDIVIEEDIDNSNLHTIWSTATVFKGTSREARFRIAEFDYETIPPGPGETEIDFPDDDESNLEDYWDNIGFSDAKYVKEGQADGALVFQGEEGLLGLSWGQIENLDLKDIRQASGGLLSYDLQVKNKIRPQGGNGSFYLLGLSFRLETEANSIYNGYGLSFFRYTSDEKIKPDKKPDWLNSLEGFDSIKDDLPYLVLWKKIDGGNIVLIDHADLRDGHAESFLTGGELNDWVTMAVSVKEKATGTGTENHITAYIEQPPNIDKGVKEWDYSKYIGVNWVNNGIGTIIDGDLDSSGVDYSGTIENDPRNYEYEIGVHAFYDGNPANQVFFSDFGLKF